MKMIAKEIYIVIGLRINVRALNVKIWILTYVKPQENVIIITPINHIQNVLIFQLKLQISALNYQMIYVHVKIKIYGVLINRIVIIAHINQPIIVKV